MDLFRLLRGHALWHGRHLEVGEVREWHLLVQRQVRWFSYMSAGERTSCGVKVYLAAMINS